MKRLYILYTFLLCSVFSYAQDTSQVGNLIGMSLQDLMDIKVVGAMGHGQTVADAPSNIRVITSKVIEERGYQTISDVLRDIEGVDIIHASGYYSDVVYFRGLYGADNLRTLFLIDGVRENDILGNQNLMGPAYPLHNVERIEIIWGPASSIYGADAVGGVINVITKTGAEMSGLHYEKEMGTYNTQSERISFGMKHKNLDVAMAGSLYSTDGPSFYNLDPFYHGSFVDRAWSFNGTLTYTYGKFKTSANYRTYYTPMSFGVFIPSATKVLNLPSQGHDNSGAIGLLYEDVRNEKPSLVEPFSGNFILKQEFNASDKLTLKGEFIYRETGITQRSYVYLSIDSFPLFSANGDTIKGLDTSHFYRAPIFNWSNRTRGDLKLNYTFNEDMNLYAGVDFSQDNLEQGLSNSTNRATFPDTNTYVMDGIPIRNVYTDFLPRHFYIRNNFGSYAQYSLRTTLLNKTIFTAGIRYDRNTDFESPLSPLLSVVISPQKELTTKLLYGVAFRAPKLAEVATLNNAGITNINPEQVRTWEVNLIYQPSAKWITQLNVFENDLSDIFVLNSLLGGGFQQKVVKGTAQIQGVEIHIDLITDNHFSAFANFTYQHGQEKDTTSKAFDIPNLPELKGNVGVTYVWADYLTVTLTGNWVGQRRLPHSNPYGADKGYMMDGYTIGNLVLTTRKFFENRVSGSVNIENLFNTSYLDPGVRTADGGLYSTVLLQPGRWMTFKVTVDL